MVYTLATTRNLVRPAAPGDRRHVAARERRGPLAQRPSRPVPIRHSSHSRWLTWYGYRYAGIRTTPNGNTHVRITAFAGSRSSTLRSA